MSLKCKMWFPSLFTPIQEKFLAKTKNYLDIVAVNSFYAAQRVPSTFSRHTLVEGSYRSSFGSVIPTRRIPYIVPILTKKTSLRLIKRYKISETTLGRDK